MENKTHIYFVEVNGNGWHEKILCESKKEVDVQVAEVLARNIARDQNEQIAITVHEGYFYLEHSTTPSLTVNW